MAEKGSLFRVRMESLPGYTRSPGIQQGSSVRYLSMSESLVWFACPVCQHAVRVDGRVSNTPSVSHFGPGCRVWFDLVAGECWVPMEDVPRAVANKLRGVR